MSGRASAGRGGRPTGRGFAAVLLCLLLGARPSSAFWVHWTTPYHQNITNQALKPVAGKRTLATLAKENANTDAAEETVKPAHFDSETFAKGSTLMKTRLNQVVQELGACDKPAALVTLARALHGLQDFYSHSIWVENRIANADTTPADVPPFGDLVTKDQTGTFAAGGLVANPNFLSTNKAPKPILQCGANDFQAHGADPARLTTGFYRDNTAPQGKCSHIQINKDSTSTAEVPGHPEFKSPRGQTVKNTVSLHRFAWDVAARHTRQLFDHVQEALRAKFPGAPGERFATLLGQDNADVVFLIDTAASMAAALPGIKAALSNAAAALAAGTDIPLLRLLPFKDTVGALVTKCEAGEFATAVNALAAAGGGNCPRASLTAIAEALKRVTPGGTLVVLTDASPSETAAVERKVTLLARKQKVAISFSLVGACPTGFAVYERLAEATGGYLLPPGAPGLDDWLAAVLDRARPDVVHLLPVPRRNTFTPQQVEMEDVDVDRSLARVDFVLSAGAGDPMTLEVKRPGGAPVVPTDLDAEFITVGRLQVVRMTAPGAGTWKMAMSGTGRYSAVAFGGSNLAITNPDLTNLLFREEAFTSGPHPLTRSLESALTLGDPIDLEAEVAGEITGPVFELLASTGASLGTVSLYEEEPGSGRFHGPYAPASPLGEFFVRVRGTNSYGDPVVRLYPQAFGVSTLGLRPVPASHLTAPGCAGTFSFELENHGPADAFAVAASSSRGFTVSPDAVTVPLDAGATATLDFVVTVPADAEAGPDELSVTATSVGDETITNAARAYHPIADCSIYCVDCAMEPTACTPAPKSGCRRSTLPSGVSLIVKDQAAATADRLVWKLVKGDATATADFGDPLATTAYALCIYDDAEGSPPLLFHAGAPAGQECATGSCWKARSNGFKYKSKLRTPRGLGKLVLKSGEAGKTALRVVGKGGNLSLPALPLGLPVRVQLQAEDGACWQATYSATGVVENDAALFKGEASSPSGAFLAP